MKQFDLNEIPKKIEEGIITNAQAVNELALFLSKNYAMFGLKIQDEDFNSEVILLLLERGEKVLSQYNPDYGSFFTFFFCFVKSIINSCNRSFIREKAHDFHNINHCTYEYDQNQEAYRKINYSDLEKTNKTYSSTPAKIKQLRLANDSDSYSVKEYMDKKDRDYLSLQNNLKKVSPIIAEKMLLVLALKSAFYITDDQIDKIAEICKLDNDALRQIIQDLKSDLYQKYERKNVLELRRNKAFFHHLKYQNQLLYFCEDNLERYEYLIPTIGKKYEIQTRRWKNLNEQLKKGVINIRPTNKSVADALGICERQVSYYIKNASNIQWLCR